MASTVVAVDNFNTPANHEFYAQSPYCDLDTSNRQIRLLEICATGDGHPLQLKLLGPFSLVPDQPLGYCAISYFAGKHSETELVYVDGTPFNAFANLARALRQVSAAQENGHLEGLPTLIWSDQICINQSNLAERSHQVGFMREIYESARAVFACLGWEDPSDGNWVQGAQRLSLDAAEFKAELRDELDVEIKASILYVNDRPFADFYNREFRQGWVAFKHLILSEWWARGWVYQEIVCAKDVLVFFGSKVLGWDTISMAGQVFKGVGVSLIRRWILEGKPSVDNDLFQDVVAGFKPAFTRFMIESHLEWRDGNKKCILELLDHAQRCQFTDPRDRIYAFLGLTDPGYAIVPDYQKDIITTYRYITKRIILYEGLLNVMCFIVAEDGRHLKDSSSWTPDWASSHSHRFIYDSIEESPSFRASGDYKAAASFHPSVMISDAILRVRGIFVDSLSDRTTSNYNDPGERRGTINGWARIARVGSESSLWDNQSEINTGSYQFDESINDVEAFWRVLFRGSPKVHNDSFYADMSRIAARVRETTDEGVLFRSRHGYLGVAKKPVKLLPDDSIWILFGSNVPVILRKKLDSYSFVSEAYVKGLMHGEAIEQMQKGDLSVETIDIQ